MNLLLIETSSINCSVAVSRNHTVLSCVEKQEVNIHAGSITLFIEQALQEAGISLEEIDAVAVGKGPGSYTGLRIGVSTAKGICYALNKPLIACNSLETIYIEAKEKQNEDAIYCPLIDARRMEVYTCLYDASGTQISEINAVVVNEDTFKEILNTSPVIFFGDGASKLKPMYEHLPNASFIDHLYPSAKYMLASAIQKFEAFTFEDVAYFEPFYLKEFYFNK